MPIDTSIESKEHVLRCARNDLSFALSYPENLKKKSDGEFSMGRSRLEHCIQMITDALGDHGAFEELKKRWAEEEKS